MEEVNPDYVLGLTEATSSFLCPISANIYNIEFLCFSVRDLDSGQLLFEVRREEDEENEVDEQPPEDDENRTIKYQFGPDFLKLRSIGSTLQFRVGNSEVRNLRMVERHYFRDRLLKNFDFNLDFCIPNSVNSWEILYEVPELPADLE
eukprot:CAMPEP_0168315936 /NCGR_PEP_ID=MMETSP0210-20121227/13348_1 /TAXON_ID=40633 /ORGANISM="Condylostoma magnum, Strain COL2" /LENGTH=147 /DNA_ID=CAMNT_0008292809 /DNA_START=15 /DNA_END=458 /DNA_ORIENTATION=+